MPLYFEQNLAVFYIDDTDARIVGCNHDAVRHDCISQELNPSDLFTSRVLTRPVATLNLLKMLQLVSLRVVNMHFAVSETCDQATTIMIE